MKRRFFIIFTLVISSVFSCNTGENSKPKENSNLMLEAQKTEDEWKKILTPEEYRVLRQKGTEYPGTGEYNLFFEDGEYKCRACSNKLFDSDTKFESHCGWPSFYDVSKSDAIREIPDSSYGMIRTEVVCAKCGGHLGHVFEDGPNPTGLRYCINSVSIKFSKKENK